jgi:hypothetical protein
MTDLNATSVIVTVTSTTNSVTFDCEVALNT